MTSPRRPGLLTELGAATLALVLVGIAGWLGFWQYDAWQERRNAEARDLTELTPVPLTDVMGSDDPFPGDRSRPTGRGRRRPGSTAASGCRGASWTGPMATGRWNPLQVDDAAVLVARGWAAEPSDDLLEATGSGTVTGWLQPPEGGMVTDDDATDDVFPEIRVADAAQRVDVDLYSAYSWPTPSGRTRRSRRPSSSRCRRRALHRGPQPALRLRVVGLRGLRGLHLVAVAPRGSYAPPTPRIG